MHLDKCFRKKHKRKASQVAWDSLGAVGQLSIFLIAFMSSTLAISIFLARAKRRRKDGESYLGFLIRDVQGRKKKKRKKLRKKIGNGTLDEDLLSDGEENVRTVPARPGRSSKKTTSSAKSIRSKSKSKRAKDDSDNKSVKSSRSRSKSRTRAKSKARTKEGADEADEAKSTKPSRSRSRSRARGTSKSVKRDSKNKKDDNSRRQLV